MPTRAQVVAAAGDRRRGDAQRYRGPHADRLRAARLLRDVSEAVLRRLGPHLSGRDARRPDAAVPRRDPHHHARVRQRPRPLARWIWDESPAFQAFRGDDVDAGALPDAARGRRSTSAGAAARPLRSPATRPTPTRSAR